MYRLLVVGGSASRSAEAFRHDGFQVEQVRTASEATRELSSGRVDLVVVDVCLPPGAETEILGDLRAKDPTVPIVVHASHPLRFSDFRTWCADKYVERSDDLGQLKEAIRSLLPRESTVPEGEAASGPHQEKDRETQGAE